MKNKKALIALLAVIAIVCLAVMTACVHDPELLAAPQITLTGNVVSWKAVENAASYEVTVGTDAPVKVNGTSYTVTKTGGGTYGITVKAISGDTSKYLDSVASNKVTYKVETTVTPTALAAPQITLTGNVVSWTAVEHAASYDVKVGTDAAVNVTTTTYTVNKTEPGSYDITVVAKSTDEAYSDSAVSNKVTYRVASPDAAFTELVLDGNYKTEYFLDEGRTTLDLTGLTAIAVFDDESEQNVDVTKLVFAQYDLTKVADLEIEVSYTDAKNVTQKTTMFITVKERKISDVTEYGTKLFEINASGKYAVDYQSVFNMKGENLLAGGQVTLAQGETLVNADGQFVLITVAHFVSNKEQFLAIADDMDGYYVLTQDIDFGGGWYNYGDRTSSSIIGAVPFNAKEAGSENNQLLDYENGVGTTQVGIPFNGTIDGQGYAVKNLKMHCSDVPYGKFGRGVSIIGYVGEDGTVCNITLRNIYVTAGWYSSLLVGYNKGTINNICVESDCVVNCSYGGKTLVAGYNDGTVSNVVSYVTTADVIIANNKEIEHEDLTLNNVLHGTSQGYIADSSDLTSELGSGWRYFDGHGTVLFNEDYVMVTAKERELPIGANLYLNDVFADGEKVNISLYNPDPIDPDTGVVKYGWDAEKGSHYLYVNTQASPMITAGSVVKVVLYTTGWKTSCEFEITVVAPVVVNNELTSASIEKIEGTDLNAADVMIKQTYSDGTENVIAALKLEGYDKNGTVGEAQTVKAFYGEGEDDYVELTVTLKAKSVTGIAMDGSSSFKTSYNEGDELDLTGAKIVVSYDNGATEKIDVTAQMLSAYSLENAGSVTITVNYSEQTCTFTVTVQAAGVTLTSISVTGTPAKTQYKLNSRDVTLENLSGVTVKAHHSDGSESNVPLTLGMISYDFNALGSKDITVSYEGKTAAITVTVVDYVTELIVTPTQTKLTYNSETTLDLVANATYTVKTASGAEQTADAGKITASDYRAGANAITYTYSDDLATVTKVQNYEIWYEIKNPAEWDLMRQNLSGYFMLGADLDFGDSNIAPVAKQPVNSANDDTTCNCDPETANIQTGVPFTGIFDGQGKVMRFIRIEGSNFSGNGFGLSLFGYIGNGAEVKNFTIRSSTFKSKNQTGFIATVNEGLVENVVIDETCSITAQYNTAGIVVFNKNNGIVRNVISYVTKGTKEDGVTEFAVRAVCGNSSSAENSVTNCFVSSDENFISNSVAALKDVEGWTVIDNYGPMYKSFAVLLSAEESMAIDGEWTFTLALSEGLYVDVMFFAGNECYSYTKNATDNPNIFRFTFTLKQEVQDKLTVGDNCSVRIRVAGTGYLPTQQVLLTAKEGA